MKNQPAVTLLLSVGRLMKGRLEKALPLPLAQCEVMRCIAEMQEPTMREVAAHFKIAAPSATALVQPLVAQGFVARTSVPHDRRQVRLGLTQKGKRIASRMEGTRSRIVEKMLSTLKRRDVADLKRILTSILTNAS